MKRDYNFLQLFNQFISESKSGKRLKKDGTKIRIGTIDFYIIVGKELERFSINNDFQLRIRSLYKLGSRELKSERIYWKRFYKEYSDYLYSIGCYDNYTGAHFKVLRTFFNYLKQEKSIFMGDIHKSFYVQTESISINVLNQEQLQFLIEDTEFENQLPLYLKRTKDIFVFGCIVGLRYSDLMTLTNRNLKKTKDAVYLCVRSIKTETDTGIKLVPHALTILNKYNGFKTLLPQLSKNRLNLNIKELCERAGWTHQVGKIRKRRGVSKKINLNGRSYRFCDLVTTHTMRRTAITTLLCCGMPETLVRKISGHSANSKEFYRYVNYSQQFIDNEIDRVYARLIPGKKTAEIS